MLVVAVLLFVEDRLGWPQWVVWTMVAAWIAKDAILYPFVWRAYDPSDPATLPYTIEGARGVAINRIDPSGLVRVWGEVWCAELSRGARRVEVGEAVQVKSRRGLTLVVEPEAKMG